MKLKLIIFFSFFTIYSFAQSASSGEAFFNAKKYDKAKGVYEALLKKRPNDALYNYRYARCCYELKDEPDAIKHFEMAGSKYPARDLYLGELYFNAYRFDESVMAYQTYVATLKPDDASIPVYQKKIQKAENAARLLSRTEEVSIIDSLVVNKNEFLKFYNISKELGTISQEQIKLNSQRTEDKIKYTTQRQDRVYFSDSIHGQMDIFTSYKLLDSWSNPVSVSKVINTPADENYPFLSLDGVTLYFSSNGQNSIGGYDIFITRYTLATDSYLPPENIGMPFNSPYNDYMMVIDEQHKRGWFATDRYQPAGKVVIYTFIPTELKTILHTDDMDYLRKAAQLKVYKKAVAGKTTTDITLPEQLEESDKNIEFVINDSVVYTDAAQFKSEEAVKLWGELHKLKNEEKQKMNQLEDLRQKYYEAQNDEERKSLTSSIFELEKDKISMDQEITDMSVKIRNAEIEYMKSEK